MLAFIGIGVTADLYGRDRRHCRRLAGVPELYSISYSITSSAVASHGMAKSKAARNLSPEREPRYEGQGGSRQPRTGREQGGNAGMPQAITGECR